MVTQETAHQGEKLLILKRRSGLSGEDLAKAFDIIPNSVSRLFKRQKLSAKIRRKAAALFKVPESYFFEPIEAPAAPAVRPEKFRDAAELLEFREREIDLLKDELEAMRQRLVEEKRISADLSEQLRQALKRT